MTRWRFWFTCLMALATEAEAVPLSTIGSFCGTFPDQCRKGTMSLLAARGSGTNVEYIIEVDPTTGALPVNVTAGTITATNPSVGTTGSSVPASATYMGGNNAGVLQGILLDSSNRQVVVGAGTAGSAAGGVLTIQGVASMTAVKVDGSGVTQPVSIATQPAPVGRTYADSVRNDYTSTSVTTGAWVQLIASTAATINCVTVFDSSGQTLELGTGAAASETRKLIIPPGGHDGCIPLLIASGTRVSIRALSATASTGEIDITGLN